MEQVTSTETTETNTSAESQAQTAPETQSTDTGTQGASENLDAKAPGEGEAPQYQPNWKFKVLNEEKEIDEWVRPVVKDAETEKKVRELYEKAFGLEPVKASREKLQKEHEELKANYSSLYTDVAEAMQFKHQGNLSQFFQKVGVTDEQLAKYMLEKINRSNLPPEQQQVYNELDAKRNAEYHQARQLEEAETRYRQIASQAREWEVDQWLAKPEVSSVVSAYDASNGPGSFKRFVAEYGVMHHSAYGEDPSVEMAVSNVLKRLGNAYSSKPATPQAPAPSYGAQQAPTRELPVIPNVSGKNVSPTQKAVRSVDDLRKLRNEMLGG